MRKILVFQHVAHEILGTLNPLLKSEGFRIRYVNFQRHPDIEPSLEGYNGLIVLGGPMGAYQAEQYPHLHREMRIIEQALRRDIPLLGICLGSQLLAEVLGGRVRKSQHKEIGWYKLSLSPAGPTDRLLKHFNDEETVFQLHGDTFDIPKDGVHLASTEICSAQAFRYQNAYGLQFHLEVDEAMIHRWLKIPHNILDMGDQFSPEKILHDTHIHIKRSLELSTKTFGEFVTNFGNKPKNILLGSGHGKSKHD